MESKIDILGLTLDLTCAACPEQYDVFLEEKLIGYLRLRNGYFRAEYPTCGGEIVYDAFPKGDGIFDSDEREFYLKEASKALLEAHNNFNQQIV